MRFTLCVSFYAVEQRICVELGWGIAMTGHHRFHEEKIVLSGPGNRMERSFAVKYVIQ